uniref:5-formyltetrahydrofolate cyclo-ligase n=1 Tax=Terrapene triunguis TaxID=2587831 RepID=A0A674IXN7_9SAUR
RGPLLDQTSAKAISPTFPRSARRVGSSKTAYQQKHLGPQTPVIGHSKYQESQRIAIFLSMQDEIETEEIIKDIFQRGKECFIPQYKPQSSHMDMVKLTSAEEISSLPLTSWNIHQPCDNDVREEALSGGKCFLLSDAESQAMPTLGSLLQPSQLTIALPSKSLLVL